MLTSTKIQNININFIIVLILHMFIYVCSEGIMNESIENSSILNLTYDEFVKNDSMLNQSLDFLNFPDNTTLNNLTAEINLTETDPVVTEEWGNTEAIELNEKYLSFTIPDEDICSCDLNTNTCDINCCCDSDCSEENMKVFSKCHFQVLVPDKNYCYQKDIIFRNNTIYRMEKDPESGLFCIVHDNLRLHLRYKDLLVLKSHRDLDLLLKYQSKQVFSWDISPEKDEHEGGEMRTGSPIYVDYLSGKHGIEKRWSLPSSCFSQACSCNQEIHYLEHFHSSCTQALSSSLSIQCVHNPSLSAENYINFCINSRSTSPDIHTYLNDLIFHTKVMNSTSENIPYTNKLCTGMKVKKPKYFNSICSDVVNGIHFIIVHDGHNGIHEIAAEFEYIDLDENTKTFLQHFSVSFEWRNATDVVRKSGNPGYQLGLPIFAGTNSSTGETDDSFMIEVKPEGLSVLDRDINNICSDRHRTIKFGHNLRISCQYIDSSGDCKALQERVMNVLLGSSKKQVFVGIFGNANESSIEDWIEAYHEEREKLQSDETCYLITGMKIKIAYAAVGTVVNPQYKILGVGYHYAKPERTDLLCPPSSCPGIRLFTSVSFFDVTEPLVPHYPKVPSIKANLPSDFFYPFLYGKQSKCVAYFYLVISVFLSVVLLN